MKNSKIRAIVILFFSVFLAAVAGRDFLRMRQPEPIYPGQGISEKKMLSDYFSPLRETNGDTEVYFFEGENQGATVLILGGTHPNEPAGFITAICLIERAQVQAGRLIVIPRANNSAFSHNDPQEANPQRFFIPTPHGMRWFRFGSRNTNPIDQWPDPEVYRHFPSGQKLSGGETRNLNRSYPGKPDGSLTEKVAFAIMELLRKEKVDLAFDLHEASLEYPVINAIVAHPNGFEMASEVVMYLQMDGLDYNLEPSPEHFRGLSHREWGDQLGIAAILMETANTVQGRYHGKLTPDAVIDGKDKIYTEAAAHGLLAVDFPPEGIPLKVRVGRHLAALQKFFEVWNGYHADKLIEIGNIPDFQEITEKGIGFFLNESK